MNNAIAIAKKTEHLFRDSHTVRDVTLFVVIGSYFFLRLLGAYGRPL